MEILIFVIIAAIVLFIGFWALIIGGAVLLIVWIILPVVLGIAGGIFIWWNGYDNAGVAFAITCFIAQFFWIRFVDKGLGGNNDPMAGKRAHYNKDGKLTGYSDRK